jgi:hypothetical protein
MKESPSNVGIYMFMETWKMNAPCWSKNENGLRDYSWKIKRTLLPLFQQQLYLFGLLPH